jgi:hypothetical protein
MSNSVVVRLENRVYFYTMKKEKTLVTTILKHLRKLKKVKKLVDCSEHTGG